MLNVLLVCSGGMSSSIVVKSIQKELEKQGVESNVKAVGTGEFEDEVNGEDWDIALVAPQVRHRMATFEVAAKEANVPIALIQPQGYTPMGGPRVVKQIKEIVKLK
ncbi:phosphotransferase system, lactose/cellobiose-specific IIB subunit [Alkaliphilus metalliredigens QYMF]|uniref:Phosphotransferase system, lactose/cellobiose-specific IIB subunit n=1 Tax=Alkaliphilus metalliredigens (strain QYMF) TaxID=293826 RepID=A6TVQ1_ALKMQ|nr:PTS sugar transporter subunit IIB [Alkaliphilus metalliredigens]ABR50269.1 phosphotransferase system, lactose/cellobiose-specific IIB subunit [Alkaliphilus metalliredigens QYMF]